MYPIPTKQSQTSKEINSADQERGAIKSDNQEEVSLAAELTPWFVDESRGLMITITQTGNPKRILEIRP